MPINISCFKITHHIQLVIFLSSLIYSDTSYFSCPFLTIHYFFRFVFIQFQYTTNQLSIINDSPGNYSPIFTPDFSLSSFNFFIPELLILHLHLSTFPLFSPVLHSRLTFLLSLPLFICLINSPSSFSPVLPSLAERPHLNCHTLTRRLRKKVVCNSSHWCVKERKELGRETKKEKKGKEGVNEKERGR